MAKYKPVATRTLPQELLDYLNSSEAARLLLMLLEINAHIKNASRRPAGYYVQEIDLSAEVEDARGIELTLSKISVRKGRNFDAILFGMRQFLIEAVERFVPEDEKVQIFCIIALDKPLRRRLFRRGSTLLEMPEEEWIQGKADLKAA